MGAIYPPSDWGNRSYDALRRVAGLTVEEAIKKATALREVYSKRYGIQAVCTNALDNPFMHDHARKTLISDMRRYSLSRLQSKCGDDTRNR